MVIRGIRSYKNAPPAVVTIGNFDGCHLGHQELLKKTVSYAAENSLTAAALTFSPRPDAWFRQELEEPLIFSSRQKSRAFAEASIETHIVQDFDEDFSKISHQSFFEEILIKTLNAKAIVVGDNFKFGHNQSGDVNFLKSAGKKAGISVFIVPASHLETKTISSTLIRSSLSKGEIDFANRLLGRPFMLEGNIVRGDQIGRTIGFPTANLEDIHQLIPRQGVYKGTVKIDNSGAGINPLKIPQDSFEAIINIGMRPTIDGTSSLRVEAHLLDVVLDANALYGKQAGYFLEKFLRPETKFASLEDLKMQIQRDIKACK